jgi:hypothetical protein
MRRPGADLEEKPEPRVALLAEAQNGDGMKQSGRGLTRAAIEKPTFEPTRVSRVCEFTTGINSASLHDAPSRTTTKKWWKSGRRSMCDNIL